MRLSTDADIQDLLHTYSHMVYRLAYARTGCHSDAEDICQEVFFKLIEKNPDFESEAKRKAWLIRATINRAIGLWHSAWHRRVVLTDAGEMRNAEPTGDEALACALSLLSPKDRILIDLFYFEGYQTDEIAAILNRRHDTVRSQLARARKRLKMELGKEG